MYRTNVTLRYRYCENCNIHLGCANIFSMTMNATLDCSNLSTNVNMVITY